MRRGFARVRRQRVKIRKGRTRGAVPTSKRALRAPSSVGKRGVWEKGGAWNFRRYTRSPAPRAPCGKAPMSSDDFGSPAQRRRKLVLRKIPTPGPLPVVRPPQKSLPFVSELVSAEAEAAAAITSSPSREELSPLQRARAVDPASHPTPPARQQPAGRWAPPPSGLAISELLPRATVAPVVTSTHPERIPAERPVWTRVSTIQAVGGGLAAIALFAALGFAVGERAERPASASANLQSPSPAIETTRTLTVPSHVLTPAYLPPTPTENVASAAESEMKPLPVESLPVVRGTSRTAASAAPPKAQAERPASSSPVDRATVSMQPPAAEDSSGEGTSNAAEPTGSSPGTAEIAPEAPPAAPAGVDPLVQAVREDIREEESRSK
jgi:hypothetical protein